MFPTLALMARRGLLEGNPVKKLKEKDWVNDTRIPLECKKCHYHRDSVGGLTHCPNCGSELKTNFQ